METENRLEKVAGLLAIVDEELWKVREDYSKIALSLTLAKRRGEEAKTEEFKKQLEGLSQKILEICDVHTHIEGGALCSLETLMEVSGNG